MICVISVYSTLSVKRSLRLIQLLRIKAHKNTVTRGPIDKIVTTGILVPSQTVHRDIHATSLPSVNSFHNKMFTEVVIMPLLNHDTPLSKDTVSSIIMLTRYLSRLSRAALGV